MLGLLLRELSPRMKSLLVTQKPDRERSASEDQEVLKLKTNRIFQAIVIDSHRRE